MECGRAAGKHDNKLSAEANLPQDGEADACSQYSVLIDVHRLENPITVPGSVSGVRSDQELQWPPDDVSADTMLTTDNSTQSWTPAGNVDTARNVLC